jgi:hypothetical protein
MYRTVLAVAATIQCLLGCVGQPRGAGAEAEVRQFLKDLVNASLKPSATDLGRFYADEFTATNASGGVLDKAAVITALTSGKLSFKSYEIDDVQVRIYGGVAVIRDSERIESNTTSGRFRHLRVVSKRDGRWQLIATQMTRIAER